MTKLIVKEAIEQYRFDDAYEKVYEYDNGTYIYFGSYFGLGITSEMSDDEKIEKCEEEWWSN